VNSLRFHPACVDGSIMFLAREGAPGRALINPRLKLVPRARGCTAFPHRYLDMRLQSLRLQVEVVYESSHAQGCIGRIPCE
jgi:hypothetical protein